LNACVSARPATHYNVLESGGESLGVTLGHLRVAHPYCRHVNDGKILQNTGVKLAAWLSS
jgi:hypothetical protein